ncbi:LD-carboxypeptidase [bacterium]|nr:LD-carboxypeptidase [bacterium]
MKSLRIPQRLKKGDLIGVISPSSPSRYPERITRGITYLMSQGFYVRLGMSVETQDGYLAGSDALRAQDIHEMFEDERVGAILCTRGGYGAGRLLDHLDYDLIRAHPKILVGFSDVTALSMAIIARSGLLSFHGPMVAAEFGVGPTEIAELAFWSMLMDRRTQRELAFGGEEALVEGTAEGMLIGGNLAVYASMIGSPYLPDPSGCILFLEDVGENVYRLDRMLLQLKHAGVLNAVAGVVLGSFTAIPEDEPNRELITVLREYLLPLQVPVMTGFPFGHIPDKVTLPLGAQVTLDTAKRQLTVRQAVVS